MADIFKIRAIQVGGETTFGTAASNYTTMRCEADSDFMPEQASIINDIAKSGDYEIARILGGKRGTATTRHKLHGWTSASVASAPSLTAADSGSATAFDQLMAILASALGNVYSGGYIGGQTVGASGSPTDTVTVTGGAELGSFIAGQAVAWATGTTRRAYEMGWITAITTGSPDSATLLQTPRRNPQGSTLWGSHNLFVRDLTPYHDGDVKSWTLKFIGHGSSDVIIGYGCQPTGVKFQVAVNQPIVVEITWGVAHWTQPGSGGGPSIPAWTLPEPQVALDWQLALFSGADVFYPTVKSLELDIGLTRVALEGGHSDSGVEGWAATMRRPKVTFSAHYHADYFEDFAAQEAFTLSFQAGTAPGRLFGFCLPAARYVELPKRSDVDGVTACDVVVEAHLYTGDSGSDLTKPYDSPLKLAFA